MNFNTIMGLDDESTPTTEATDRQKTTFQKVAVGLGTFGIAAGGVLAGILVMEHVTKDAKACANYVKDVREKAETEKRNNKAVEMAAFKKSLIEQGWSEEDALEAAIATYGNKK